MITSPPPLPLVALPAYTMDTVPGSAFALQASGGVFQSANEEGQFLAPEGADTSSEGT